MGDFLFKDGQTVVFVGDSITDCGRRGPDALYGNGYVKLAVDLITAKYPERRITFLNEGIGGNTVEDLRNRWHDDVLRHRPDSVHRNIGVKSCLTMAFEVSSSPNQEVRDAQKPGEDRANLPRGA